MSARGQKRKPSRYHDYELEAEFSPPKRSHRPSGDGEGGGGLVVAADEHLGDSGRSPRVRKKSAKLRDSDKEVFSPTPATPTYTTGAVRSPQKSSSSKARKQDIHGLEAAHYSQDPSLYLSDIPTSGSSHKKDKGKHKKSKLEPLYIDTTEILDPVPKKHSKGSHHHHKHDRERKSKKSHGSKEEDLLHSPDESDVHVEEMEGIKLKLILSPKERGAGSSEEKETKSKKSGSHKKEKEETSHKKDKKSKSKDHSASSEDGKGKKKDKKKKKEKHKSAEELSFESSMDESFASVGASPSFSLPQFGNYGMGMMDTDEATSKDKMKITLKLGGSGTKKEEGAYSGGVPVLEDHLGPGPFEFPPYTVEDTEVSSQSQSDSALASPNDTKQKQKKEKKEKKEKKKKEKAPKEEKKPRKKVMTAYMLWSKHQRQKVVEANPGIDFSTISKKLGEMWQQLPEKEKMVWRSKRLTLEHKQKKAAATTVKRKVTALSPLRGGAVSPEPVMSPVKTPVPGTSPIDVAAHLKLLGESLSLVGQRLHETEGHIAIHGGLSVLLDSMVCALGPLLSLTRQVPEINGCPQEVHERTLDNVAYIMPGL